MKIILTLLFLWLISGTFQHLAKYKKHRKNRHEKTYSFLSNLFKKIKNRKLHNHNAKSRMLRVYNHFFPEEPKELLNKRLGPYLNNVSKLKSNEETGKTHDILSRNLNKVKNNQPSKSAEKKSSQNENEIQQESSKKQPAKKDPAKKEPAKKQSAKKEPAKKEPAKKEDAKKEPAKKQPAKKEPAKKEPAKKEPAKKEPAKKEPAKKEPAKKEPAKKEPAKKEPAKKKPAKKGPAKKEPAKKEPAKKEPAKKEPAKKEPAKKEPAKKEPAKKEPAKKEPAKKEPAKKEPAKKEPAKKISKKRVTKKIIKKKKKVTKKVSKKEASKKKKITKNMWKEKQSKALESTQKELQDISNNKEKNKGLIKNENGNQDNIGGHFPINTNDQYNTLDTQSNTSKNEKLTPVNQGFTQERGNIQTHRNNTNYYSSQSDNSSQNLHFNRDYNPTESQFIPKHSQRRVKWKKVKFTRKSKLCNTDETNSCEFKCSMREGMNLCLKRAKLSYRTFDKQNHSKIINRICICNDKAHKYRIIT